MATTEIIGKQFNRYGETYKVTSHVYTFERKEEPGVLAGVCVKAIKVATAPYYFDRGPEQKGRIFFCELESKDNIFWKTISLAQDDYLVINPASPTQVAHIDNALEMWTPVVS